MGFLDFFGKKPVREGLYDLQCELHPFRLAAHRNDAVDLEIFVRNIHDQQLLTSVTVTVPKNIGMDRTGLSHEREIRLGPLEPNASKRFKVGVFSNQKSAPGNYQVDVYVSAHYRDYGHLLNQTRRKLLARVE